MGGSQFQIVKPENQSDSVTCRHRYHVQVIDRVVALLGEMASSDRELSGNELAGKLGLHKSTVHRLLAVLMANGMVERKPGAARYGLGWRIFDFGMVAASRLGLLENVRPYVARLVELTGETAHFGVLRRGGVMSLVSVESQQTVHKPATVGRQIPIHSTAQGKAIVAFLPRQQAEELLKAYVFTRHTCNSIAGLEQFREELSLVHERGYAVDNEELEEGLRCVAAPVRDCAGLIIGALGIAGPASRISGGRLPAMSRAVTDSANSLSAALSNR